MRGGLAWLALLLAASAAAEPLATDPAGDSVAAGAVPAPADSFPAADLLGLSIDAVPPDLLVSFQLADLETERPVVDAAVYTAEFSFDGARYQLAIDRNVPVDANERYDAQLYLFDDGLDYWRLYLELADPVETAPDVITAAVPLQKITDPTGLPVRNGSRLTDLVAQSVHGQDRIAGGATVTPAGELPVPLPYAVHDRLPDTGSLVYAVALPLTGGSVLLDSPDPARVTNGGPGTFVYPLRATNAVDQPVVASFAVEGLPDGWAWSVVDEQMELAPQESRTTSVVVRPPLNHVHGASTNLTVRVLVDGRPTEATAVLQLLYSDPAQPAGHHPRLYLHSGDNEDVLMLYQALEPAFGWTNRVPFMTTDEEDPRDGGGPVNADYLDGGYQWRIPMSPGLGMGLDAEVPGTARLAATFASSGLRVEDASFQARLVLANASGDLLLAEGPRTEPMAVEGPTDVELEMAMLPAADYVPYAPRTNLVLVVAVTYTEPGARIGYTTLDLLDGGWLELPLQEYQDQVPLQELGGLRIAVDPDPARANPGDLVGFTVHLTNEGADAVEAAVEPLDVSAGSIASLGASRLRIAAGATAELDVGVVVADHAIDGELFNAFVAIRPDGGPAALVRLTTLVTTEDAVESAAAAGGKDAPAAAVPAAALALLGAVALARRRGPP